MITKIGVNPTLPFSQTKEKMKRPKIEDWVIQAGEETEDMPVGAFLPNAYREAQDNYIDQLEAENKELNEKVKRVEMYAEFCIECDRNNMNPLEFESYLNLNIK